MKSKVIFWLIIARSFIFHQSDIINEDLKIRRVMEGLVE